MRPHGPQTVATRPCPPASPRAPIQVVLGGPRGPEAFKGAYWDPKGNPMGILRRVPLGSQRATRGPRKDAGGPTGEPLGTHAPPGESKGPWEPMVTPLGGQRGSMQTPGGFPLGSWIGRPIFLPCTQAILRLRRTQRRPMKYMPTPVVFVVAICVSVYSEQLRTSFRKNDTNTAEVSM